MPSEPVVSIVTAARSVRPELERCLASIDAHAGVAVETIVVDNASEDDTREWLLSTHPDVTLIGLERNEFDTARNHALLRARAPLVLFLDSDATLTPGALPTLVAALERNPSWAMVVPKLLYDDGSFQLSCRRYPPVLLPLLRRPPLGRLFEQSRRVRRHLMTDLDPDRTRPVLYAIGACQLFRTELALRLGGMDWSLRWGWADIDWCFRMRDAGGEIVYVPEAVVYHSYRRLTNKRPVSGAALRALGSFASFQWKYRTRRRELMRLSDELDRRARAT